MYTNNNRMNEEYYHSGDSVLDRFIMTNKKKIRSGWRNVKTIASALDNKELLQLGLNETLSYFQNEFKWMMVRSLFWIYLGLILASGGFVGLVTMPIVSRLFFNTWQFWKYLKYYPKLMVQGYRVVLMMIKDTSYKFVFTVPLNSPPLKTPDRTNVKLSRGWVHEENTCAPCVRCCSKISCPLLNVKEGTCISYDSFYWRYSLCGRFPITQQQIDFYQCPKWEMK